MSINPKILAKMGRDDDGMEPEVNGVPVAVTLEGSPKQIQWAQTIRTDALKLRWPEATRALLLRIKDATWWIANKSVTRSMKFKQPDAKQLASGCSPSAPGATRQPDDSPPSDLAASDFESCPHCRASFSFKKPEGNRCPYCDKLLTIIPARTEAAEEMHKLEERVTDAEKWAESVSHNPKLAESAILAVLSKLYRQKDNIPMADRLRSASWMRLGEAQCA